MLKKNFWIALGVVILIFVALFLISSMTEIREGGMYSCSYAESIVEDCPTLDDPVCGFYNSNEECDKPSCHKTFSNSCEACGEENIAAYVKGKCN